MDTKTFADLTSWIDRTLYTPTQLAKAWPGTSRNVRSIYRLMDRRRRGPRLEYMMVGRRRVITRTAIVHYLAAVNGFSRRPTPPPLLTSPSAAETAELREEGLI